MSAKSTLTPLPMRITALQRERLVAARERDGTSIQEHVRRALDMYLDAIEKIVAAAPRPINNQRPSRLEVIDLLKNSTNALPSHIASLEAMSDADYVKLRESVYAKQQG